MIWFWGENHSHPIFYLSRIFLLIIGAPSNLEEKPFWLRNQKTCESATLKLLPTDETDDLISFFLSV